jgi:hypothetical protein
MVGQNLKPLHAALSSYDTHVLIETYWRLKQEIKQHCSLGRDLHRVFVKYELIIRANRGEVAAREFAMAREWSVLSPQLAEAA